jgi:uncharacterized protein
LFDLWLADFKDGAPTTSVRQFEALFFTYVGLEPPDCSLMKECGPYVVIEHNGNVYSCDFFVEPKWRLGNIMHECIINMLNSKAQQTFGAAKALLPRECRQCTWLRNCFGGCTKDRIKDPADHRNPRYRISTKMFLKHADPVFKKLAADWKEKQATQYEKERPGGVYNAFNYFLPNQH